jgi:hypothetical protein
MTQTSTTKVIAPAWDAVWRALKGWSLWKSRINTFCDTDEAVKDFIRQDASVARCPMVAAQWDATDPTWWVQSQQEWKCPLRISIYVQRDRFSLGMDLIEDAIDAIFRFESDESTEAAPVPLIKKLTCRDPEVLQFTPCVPIEVGENSQHKLLISTVVVRLSLRKDPKIRGT